GGDRKSGRENLPLFLSGGTVEAHLGFGHSVEPFFRDWLVAVNAHTVGSILDALQGALNRFEAPLKVLFQREAIYVRLNLIGLILKVDVVVAVELRSCTIPLP